MKSHCAADALSDTVVCVQDDVRPVDVQAIAEERRSTHAAVFDGNRFRGVVALSKIAFSQSERIFADLFDKFSPLRSVSPETPLDDVARIFEEEQRDNLVVQEADEEYVGTITQQSLLQALLEWTREVSAEQEKFNTELERRVEDRTKALAESERRLRNGNRILETLSSDASLEQTLDLIARSVEAEDPSALCSILLLDESGKHLLHGAAPSLPDFYNQAIHGIAIGECVGSCGTAAATKSRVIADDIHTHPGWAKFLTLADKAGVRSCWSEPVLADAGQVLGTFAVYHREPRTPNEKDVERIQWAASFVRLAIQRKQTQAKLVENERFNRATLDALSAHVAVLDAAGKIVTTNRAWRTFAEANDTPWQTVGEGTNYLAICDRAAAAGDADAAAAARAIRQVLAGEQETWLHQYPCHSADERRWFYCRVTKFPKNGAVHVVVAHENITAMKQAQEQFAAARARFESLDRVSLVGIMFFDCAGKCMDVNERWCEMSSIGREAALGDGRLVAVHPEDRAEVSRRWSQTARAGEGSRSEVRVLRPNGEVAWFLSHTTPTREELGYVTGFVRVCVEITEQKQMEQVHQFLSANVSVLRGTEFFEAVVAKMAELLNCEFCLICRSDAAASEQLVTLAYFADGKIQPNFSYGTAGTPCEHVVDRISCIIPHGVREKFSQDIFLRDHHIESYVGVPFLDSRGRQVGHIAVMSRQPQKHPESIEPIIRFFAVTVVAEMERQTTERRYSDLFELSPDAIVMTDREGVIVEANRQVANVFGWTPAELVGQPVEVLMPANLRAAHPRLRERYLESAVPRAMGSGRSDLLGLRKDGSIFPVDISLSPMETPDGLLIVASVRDVTERQRVQEQLRRSEARYRELFESSRDAVMTPSPQTGRFTSGNPATIHMFGVKDQEHFCTLGPWALSPELQPDGSLSIDKATEQIATAMRDGSQFFEWTHRRIGGELFPATVLLARVELDGQAMLQATVRDISNEKLFLKELQEAAEELKAANAVIEQERAQLAERVAERTAELTAANDELVRASRFKSEFLASMSHELRTPLNGVLGMNELLLKTPLTEQQREFVAASNASGVALLSLINDVLDISKIEAGKLELDPRDCDLEPLAYGVVTMFEHRAREKGVALSCRLAPETCVTVLCDDNRLRQVLVNLIGNALKFTTTGSVMLESHCVQSDEQRIVVRLAVTDTGLGIPEDKVNRLFSPFSQVDSSTTRQFGGTGLGLSIVKQLAELMGGTIGAKSRVGFGSTFWVEVPFERVQAGIKTEQRRQILSGIKVLAVDGVAEEPDAKFSAHILVAEDNKINQMFIRELLKSFGCTCDIAINGDFALTALQQKRYDLVLMDCQMPEMDGFTATREIRRREAAGELPGRMAIIALTANAIKGDRERCLEAGMDDYLTKPLEAAQLHAMFRKYLGRTSPPPTPTGKGI